LSVAAKYRREKIAFAPPKFGRSNRSWCRKNSRCLPHAVPGDPKFSPKPKQTVIAGRRIFKAMRHIAHKANQNEMLDTLLSEPMASEQQFR
jgi:hypothetical protein